MLRQLVLLLACLGAASGFAMAPSSQLTQSRAAATPISMTAATKATRVNIRNREYNKKYKSEMRTRVKRVRAAIRAGFPPLRPQEL